jgi:hypothetical protein
VTDKTDANTIAGTRSDTEQSWDEIARVFEIEPRKAVDLAEELEHAPEKKFDSRRAHQCHHDGCDSPAEWEVYLHIHYGLHHAASQTLKSTVRVCDRHRRHANDYILSETNKALISRELAKIGRLRIDWANAMIEFVPCGEIAWGPEQMMRLQTGTA